MKMPKISYFRYKQYNDVYVTNFSVSADMLMSMLNSFSGQRIFALIESDADSIKKLSAISKCIGITEVVRYSHTERYAFTCNKTDLHYLISNMNLADLDGMFIANIHSDIVPDRFTVSLDHITNTMVKKGLADVVFFVHFPENQMIISARKNVYSVKQIVTLINDSFR